MSDLWYICSSQLLISASSVPISVKPVAHAGVVTCVVDVIVIVVSELSNLYWVICDDISRSSMSLSLTIISTSILLFGLFNQQVFLCLRKALHKV